MIKTPRRVQLTMPSPDTKAIVDYLRNLHMEFNRVLLLLNADLTQDTATLEIYDHKPDSYQLDEGQKYLCFEGDEARLYTKIRGKLYYTVLTEEV